MINLAKKIILFVLVWMTCLSPLEVWAKKNQPADVFQDLSQLVFSGQHSRALEILKAFKQKKSKDIWEKRLQFLAAYLYYKAGDFDKAVKGFIQLQGDYPPVDDYVDFYLALALRDSGKAPAAIEILKKLKSQNRSASLSPKLDREIALAYCKAGERGPAIDLINELIQTESSETITYHLRYDRAQCLLTLGQSQEAAAGFRSLYLSYPEGDLGDSIREALKKIGKDQNLSASEYLQRAETLLRNKRADLAVADYEAAQKIYGSSAPLSFKKTLAETYFKARKYTEAATLYEELKKKDASNFDQKDLEQLAQAYARSDQFSKAIATYEELRKTDTTANQANFEYKIAFLTMDKGDYQEANQRYLELLDHYPQHPKRAQIRWYLAWDNYLLAQYDEALRDLEMLQLESPRSEEAKRIPYWRARILEKQGKSAEARAAYEQIAQEGMFSYYGFLSLKRLEKEFDPESPPKHSWVNELPHQHIPAPLSLSSSDPGGKQEVQRLKELLLIGLWEDFMAELDQVTAREGIVGDPSSLSWSATSTNNENGENAGPWTDRYPPAYATLVSLFTQNGRFPMALTWGIMREESHFQPEIVSPAQAIGLMQIIPPTGCEIAKDLGRNGFIPENLYKPAVNIEYGVHYLAKNLSRFQGNVIYTIASYNAGPESVERWLKSRPNREWDEFVEEIPYQETNNYVKKVLKSYYIYSLIYSSS